MTIFVLRRDDDREPGMPEMLAAERGALVREAVDWISTTHGVTPETARHYCDMALTDRRWRIEKMEAE
jgi:hypothetical protein